jgi:hypothetical protein
LQLRVEDITAKIQQETAARYAMWDIWNSPWEIRLMKDDFRRVTLSIRTHETNGEPLDGFPWNSVLWSWSKICKQIASLVKIWQK